MALLTCWGYLEMSSPRAFFIISVLATMFLVTNAMAQNTLAGLEARGITYLNADRTAYMQVKDQVAHLDTISSQYDSQTVDQGAEATVRNCSDRSYRCVQISNMVLAAPRGKLSASGVYVVAGAKLTIQR